MPAQPAAVPNTDTGADADADAVPRYQTICAAVARLAARAGAPAYLVGGTVRDRLLRMPLTDLDIVIIGDAPALARRLADQMNAGLTIHPRFGTATVAISDTDTAAAANAITTIDLVTARRETYPRPGALPVVEPGSLHDDLARRDFTINAMAIPLTPDAARAVVDPNNIVDPHNGRADLTAGVIRILHPQSFRDDPTRILRAARYAARFNFPLAADTLPPLRQALADHALDTISGDRIRHELERILNEPSPASALRLADRWGILAAIHPDLTARHLPDPNAARQRSQLDGSTSTVIPATSTVIPATSTVIPAQAGTCLAESAGSPARPPEKNPCHAAAQPASTDRQPDSDLDLDSDSASPLTWLAMLAWPLPAPAARALARRLNAPAAWTRLLDDTARLAALLPALAIPGQPPSAICALLDRIAPPALAAGAALFPDAAAANTIARYRNEWQPITPRLNGADLIRLGIPPGPAVDETLRALRQARLDGAAPTIEDERRLASRRATAATA